MISDFGGGHGVRDHGLLQSAVAMPSSRYAGELLHRGIPAMAAAYLFHLCSNHPFIDGNKRTALAVAEVFLRLNDFKLAAKDELVEGLTMGVAAGKVPKEEVVSFFRQHTKTG